MNSLQRKRNRLFIYFEREESCYSSLSQRQSVNRRFRHNLHDLVIQLLPDIYIKVTYQGNWLHGIFFSYFCKSPPKFMWKLQHRALIYCWVISRKYVYASVTFRDITVTLNNLSITGWTGVAGSEMCCHEEYAITKLYQPITNDITQLIPLVLMPGFIGTIKPLSLLMVPWLIASVGLWPLLLTWFNFNPSMDK